MLNVSRLIKVSIAAFAVVAGGATAMAVVGNGQASYAATATDSALQSTTNRFRSEFAAPDENMRAWWPASTQSYTLAAKDHRLPTTKARAVRHPKRLIDGGYPFAESGWQRSVAAAHAEVI